MSINKRMITFTFHQLYYVDPDSSGLDKYLGDSMVIAKVESIIVIKVFLTFSFNFCMTHKFFTFPTSQFSMNRLRKDHQ